MNQMAHDFKASHRFGYYSFQFMDHFLGRQRVDKLWGTSRKRLLGSMYGRLKNKELQPPIPIERRTGLSAKDFRREFLNKGRPVILEGAAKDWACCKKWNMEMFDSRHGNEEILLIANSGVGTNDDFDSVYESTTLGKVIANIRTGGSKYLSFYPILERHPEYYKDLDVPWLKARRHTRGNLYRAAQLFLGGKGTESALHCAHQANLFIQVWGEKHWLLYPRTSTPTVDPDPVRNLYRNVHFRSGMPFNSFQPDFGAHPQFEHTTTYEAHLKPCDIPYNPPYMWHSVRNLTDSIACSYRWTNPLYSFRLFPVFFLLDLCARKPNFIKSLKLGSEDFNLVRLAEEGLLEEYLEKRNVSAS